MGSRLASNVIWNWCGVIVTVLAGFIVAPYLVHRLGNTAYGLWILIASMSGYFGLLDLGVRGSVGRYIAFYRARAEQDEVNRTLSTALTLLCGVGALALAATVGVLLVFFHLFEAPAEFVPVAQVAIVIIGVNLALTFPVSAFDGVLWGMERFDLLNAVDIPTAVLRAAMTFWLVKGPEDIISLAWITLATTAGNEMAKAALAFHVDRGLRFSVRLFDLSHARQLYGYGFWQFLLQIARQVSMQIGPLVIGGLVAVAAVTPYSLAGRLIAYANQFMVAATGAITPIATRLHARSEKANEKHLFIEGGKWCTAFGLFSCGCLVLLGRPFLRLWMDEQIAAESAPALIVLAVGEVLAMSQWLTYSIMLGKAKHRAMAVASVAEAAIAGLGGALGAIYGGVLGVCVAFGAAAFLCRGLFQVLYACHALRVGVGEYLRKAILAPLGAALVPGAVLTWMLWLHRPVGWVELFLYGGGFAAVYAANAFVLLGGRRLLPGYGDQIGIAEAEEAHV